MQNEICACVLLLKMLVTSTYKIFAAYPIANIALINRVTEQAENV